MAAIRNDPFRSPLTNGMVALSHSLVRFRHSRDLFPLLCMMELEGILVQSDCREHFVYWPERLASATLLGIRVVLLIPFGDALSFGPNRTRSW
jgi:hypothetical protein